VGGPRRDGIPGHGSAPVPVGGGCQVVDRRIGVAALDRQKCSYRADVWFEVARLLRVEAILERARTV